MFREVSLAFLAIFALNASALKIPGQCPQEPYPVIQNFTESSYFGDWYLIERYDNWWQQGLDCNKINYGLNPNNSYSVLVESQLRNNVPEYNSVLGYGVLSFPLANPPTGQWNQSFYGSPPDRVNYNILATDYDTFSVVWGCDNISDTEKEETFFVLSREWTLEPRPVEVETIINRYFQRRYIRTEIQDPSCYASA